jgi:hypothetical protein
VGEGKEEAGGVKYKEAVSMDDVPTSPKGCPKWTVKQCGIDVGHIVQIARAKKKIRGHIGEQEMPLPPSSEG